MGWEPLSRALERAGAHVATGFTAQQQAVLQCLILCAHPADRFGNANERTEPCNRGCVRRGRCWVMRNAVFKAVMQLLNVNMNAARGLVLAQIMHLKRAGGAGAHVFEDAVRGARRLLGS
jgi:hypothetical protein